MTDLDLAGLGLLSHRDLDRQHPGGVAGLDALDIQGLAEEQLPPEHPVRPLGRDQSGRTEDDPLVVTARAEGLKAWEVMDANADSRLSALWQRESLFDEQGLLRVRGMIATG